jgi:hypothetical protein
LDPWVPSGPTRSTSRIDGGVEAEDGLHDGGGIERRVVGKAFAGEQHTDGGQSVEGRVDGLGPRQVRVHHFGRRHLALGDHRGQLAGPTAPQLSIVAPIDT